MADFSVKTINLEKISSQLCDIKGELGQIGEAVNNAGKVSFLEVSQGYRQIRRRIYAVAGKLSAYEKLSAQMGTALADIALLYEKAEQNILGNGDSFLAEREKADKVQDSLFDVGRIKDWLRKYLDGESDSSSEDEIKLWLKTLFRSNEMDGDGLIDSVLGYIGGIEDFLRWWVDGKGNPADGWVNVCDLSNTSSKLWDAIYKYFSSQDATGVFRKQWGDKVAFVNVLGSLMGMTGDAIEAVSDREGDGWQKASNLVDVMNGGAEVEGAVAKFEAVVKGTDAGPVKLWTTLVNTVFSTISQTFDSISKYSKDGTWDTHDTAATMMEASISGLDAELSGIISFFTLGFMDMDTVRAVCNLPTPEEASDMLENWSDETGKELGNFILRDKHLTRMARNGNFLEKTASYATAAAGVHLERTTTRIDPSHAAARTRALEMERMVHGSGRKSAEEGMYERIIASRQRSAD